MLSRLIISAAVLVAAIAASIGTAFATADDQERIRGLILIQEALSRRDYDAAFRLVLGNRSDASQAAEELSVILLDGLEVLAMEEHDGSLDWYRRDLMFKLPMSERYRAGLIWKRRAAALGFERAIMDFAQAYHFARFGMPHDEELSTCFRRAVSSREEVATCQRMEQERGYLDVQVARSAPYAGTPSDISQAREAAAAALERDDLNGAYSFLLPYAERGDEGSQYFISGILLYADWAPIERYTLAERRWRGLMFLRWAVDRNLHAALRELSDAYKEGRIDLPMDAELAACFRAAEVNSSQITACRQMEAARGYTNTP